MDGQNPYSKYLQDQPDTRQTDKPFENERLEPAIKSVNNQEERPRQAAIAEAEHREAVAKQEQKQPVSDANPYDRYLSPADRQANERRRLILNGRDALSPFIGEKFGTLDEGEKADEIGRRSKENQEQLNYLRTKSDILDKVPLIEYHPGIQIYRSNLRDEIKKREAYVDVLDMAKSGKIKGMDTAAWRNNINAGAGAFANTVATATLKAAGIVAAYVGATDKPASETAAYKLGQDVEDFVKQSFPNDPARQIDFGNKLSQGVGSMAAFMGTGFLGSVVGLGRKGTLALISVFGGAAEGSQQYDQAKEILLQAARDHEKKTGSKLKFSEAEATALRAAGLGFLLGLTESASFVRATGGAGLTKRLTEGVVDEAIQEGSVELGGNIIEKYVYNPDKSLTEGVGDAAAIGAITGGVMASFRGGFRLDDLEDKPKDEPETKQPDEAAKDNAETEPPPSPPQEPQPVDASQVQVPEATQSDIDRAAELIGLKEPDDTSNDTTAKLAEKRRQGAEFSPEVDKVLDDVIGVSKERVAAQTETAEDSDEESTLYDEETGVLYAVSGGGKTRKIPEIGKGKDIELVKDIDKLPKPIMVRFAEALNIDSSGKKKELSERIQSYYTKQNDLQLGQQAYENDLKNTPRFPDGSSRPGWSELDNIAKRSWIQEEGRQGQKNTGFGFIATLEQVISEFKAEAESGSGKIPDIKSVEDVGKLTKPLLVKLAREIRARSTGTKKQLVEHIQRRRFEVIITEQNKEEARQAKPWGGGGVDNDVVKQKGTEAASKFDADFLAAVKKITADAKSEAAADSGKSGALVERARTTLTTGSQEDIRALMKEVRTGKLTKNDLLDLAEVAGAKVKKSARKNEVFEALIERLKGYVAKTSQEFSPYRRDSAKAQPKSSGTSIYGQSFRDAGDAKQMPLIRAVQQGRVDAFFRDNTRTSAEKRDLWSAFFGADMRAMDSLSDAEFKSRLIEEARRKIDEQSDTALSDREVFERDMRRVLDDAGLPQDGIDTAVETALREYDQNSGTAGRSLVGDDNPYAGATSQSKGYPGAPVPKQQPSAVEYEGEILTAYKAKRSGPEQWVFLNDIQDFLKHIPRDRVDEALMRMFLDKRIQLTLKEDQKALTQEQRDAAVRVGGEDMHLMKVRNTAAQPAQAEDTAFQDRLDKVNNAIDKVLDKKKEKKKKPKPQKETVPGNRQPPPGGWNGTMKNEGFFSVSSEAQEIILLIDASLKDVSAYDSVPDLLKKGGRKVGEEVLTAYDMTVQRGGIAAQVLRVQKQEVRYVALTNALNDVAVAASGQSSNTALAELQARLKSLTIADLREVYRDVYISEAHRSNRKTDLIDALMGYVGEPKVSRPPTPAPTRTASPDIRSRIDQAYRKRAGRSDDWIDIAEIRDDLAGIPRADVDATLMRMFLDKEIRLTLREDQKDITQKQRDAAIRVGVQDMHLISIEKPLADTQASTATPTLPEKVAEAPARMPAPTLKEIIKLRDYYMQRLANGETVDIPDYIVNTNLEAMTQPEISVPEGVRIGQLKSIRRKPSEAASNADGYIQRLEDADTDESAFFEVFGRLSKDRKIKNKDLDEIGAAYLDMPEFKSIYKRRADKLRQIEMAFRQRQSVESHSRVVRSTSPWQASSGQSRGRGSDLLQATYQSPDGSTFTIDVSPNLLFSARFFFSPADRSIVSNLIFVPGKVGHAMAGGVNHEIVHALWKGLDSRIIDNLTAHSESLLSRPGAPGVLDMTMGEYMDIIGDPTAKGEFSKYKIKDVYETLYKGHSGAEITDLLRQEAVAHMVELNTHGYFTAEQMAPIADELHAMGFGAGTITSEHVYGDKALRAYHGTNRDFDKFDISKTKMGSIGVHFGSSEAANEFSGGSKILAADINVRNPYVTAKISPRAGFADELVSNGVDMSKSEYAIIKLFEKQDVLDDLAKGMSIDDLQADYTARVNAAIEGNVAQKVAAKADKKGAKQNLQYLKLVKSYYDAEKSIPSMDNYNETVRSVLLRNGYDAIKVSDGSSYSNHYIAIKQGTVISPYSNNELLATSGQSFNSERNRIEDGISDMIATLKSGKTYAVPSQYVDQAVDAIKRNERFIPPGARVGTVESVKVIPVSKRTKEGVNLTVTYRKSDGSSFDVDIAGSIFLNAGALHANGSILIRHIEADGVVEAFAKHLDAKIRHEAVHAGWSNLPDFEKQILVFFAKSSGTLNLRFADVAAFRHGVSPSDLGPEYSVTIEESYRQFHESIRFSNPAAYDDILNQEAVAHLVELYTLGYYTTEQMAPISEQMTALEYGQEQQLFATSGQDGNFIPAFNLKDKNKPSDQIKSLNTILRDLSADLGIPIRHGGRLRKYFGYNVESGISRQRTYYNLHEFTTNAADALRARTPELDQVVADNDAELSAMGNDADIGFANFVKLYVTSPAVAEQTAPDTHAQFEAIMAAYMPVELAKLKLAQQELRNYMQADPTAQLESMIVPPDKQRPLVESLTELDPDGLFNKIGLRLRMLYTNVFDRAHPFWYANKFLLDVYQKNTGTRHPGQKVVENANKLLRLSGHSHNAAGQDLEQGVRHRILNEHAGPSMVEALTVALGSSRAEAIDMSAGSRYRQFGAYLIARRARALWDRYQRGELERPPIHEHADPAMLNDAIQHLEAKYPTFAAAANMIYDYQHRLLELQRDSGLITNETYQELVTHTDYVPFMRSFDEEGAGAGGVMGGGKNLFHKFRGSNRDIIDPIASIAQKTYETRRLIGLNDTKIALLRTAEMAGPGGGAIAERVELDRLKGMKASVVEDLKKAAKDLDVDGQDVTTLVSLAHQVMGNDAWATSYGSSATAGNKPLVWAFENGQPVAFELSSTWLGKMMYETLQTFGQEHTNILIKMMSMPSQFVRGTVTSHPEFIFRNMWVDSMMANMYDPSMVPIYSQVKGMVRALSGGEDVQKYVANSGFMGGIQASALDDLRLDQDVRTLVSRGYNPVIWENPREWVGKFMDDWGMQSNLSRAGFAATIAGGAFLGGATFAGIAGFGYAMATKGGRRAMAKFTEASETGTRMQLFERAVERARSHGLNEAEAAAEGAMHAQDFMDYSRHGLKMHSFTKLVAFMNAAMVGTDRYVRNLLAMGDSGSAYKYASGQDIMRAWVPFLKYRMGEHSTELTPREVEELGRSAQTWAWSVFYMGTASLLLTAWNKYWDDDEEIKDIAQNIRDTHWVISLNGLEHVIPKDMHSWMSEDRSVRLPKGFENAWFANLVEHAIDGFADENPRWLENYISSLYETITPPLEPTVTSLGYGLYMGKDSFSGRDITPFFDSTSRRENLYGPYTSEFAKDIGPKVGIAPYYVDWGLKGLGTSWARDALNLNIPGTQWYNPQKAESGLDEYFIARRFMWKQGRASEAVGTFYDMQRGDTPSGILEWLFTPYSKLGASARDYNNAAKLDPASAADMLSTFTPRERGHSILNAYAKHSNRHLRMLDPVNRARRILKDTNMIMKSIQTDDFRKDRTRSKPGTKIPLTPREKRLARDILTQYKMMIAHNSLVATKERGWAQKNTFAIGPVLRELEEAVPAVHKELTKALKKAKVMRFDKVTAQWPKVRQLLESDETLGQVRAGNTAILLSKLSQFHAQTK